MKRSLLLKTISSRRQLQKLKNLSKGINIRRFHFRKMVFCTTKEGPFKTYSPHNKRATIKIWLAVYCCMEDYSTTAFIQLFVQFSCEVGYPKFLSVDKGSQFVKGCQSMKFTYTDTKYKLHKDLMVEFDTCLGGHNYNGKVERTIRQIKESFEKNNQNERLSVLQRETLSSMIANTFNDLPIGLGNIISDYENVDLTTQNLLRLRKSNNRCPAATMEATGRPDRILKASRKFFEAWFISHAPRLMNHPKWFSTDHDIKICEVVLFLKLDGGA